ncbi:MAG: hypothetical protein KFF50_03155 [Desulfatitalea sp.]|nr:hypothetical protein [Desulfatitalea sp.]
MRLMAAHLQEQALRGHIRLGVPAEEITTLLIPVNQAILFSDHAIGRSPAIERACTLIRIVIASSQLPEVRTALTIAARTAE